MDELQVMADTCVIGPDTRTGTAGHAVQLLPIVGHAA